MLFRSNASAESIAPLVTSTDSVVLNCDISLKQESTEYADSCFKLISQFKTTESVLVTSGAILSADAFITEYEIDCPRAYERLLRVGVPATVVHATHDKRAEIVIVAETVQEFITAMDGIKLGTSLLIYSTWNIMKKLYLSSSEWRY